MVPDGIRLVHLPPYTPELQPTECLWKLVDEPIVNRHFDTIGELQSVIETRCVGLVRNTQITRAVTGSIGGHNRRADLFNRSWYEAVA
jgi:transposase